MSRNSFEVYDVTTGIANLIAGTGGVAAWADLGSGVNFGSYVATAADNDAFVDILLNSAALSGLNAATDLYAFGGMISTLNAVADDEHLFAWTHHYPELSNTQLILTTVPEPATIALVGLGLAGFGFARKRKQA